MRNKTVETDLTVEIFHGNMKEVVDKKKSITSFIFYLIFEYKKRS